MAEGLYRIGGKSGNGRRAILTGLNHVRVCAFDKFVFMYEKFSRDSSSKDLVKPLKKKMPCCVFSAHKLL